MILLGAASIRKQCQCAFADGAAFRRTSPVQSIRVQYRESTLETESAVQYWTVLYTKSVRRKLRVVSVLHGKSNSEFYQNHANKRSQTKTFTKLKTLPILRTSQN
jgi:hypothetical protein